jgi:hypothetical protein
MSGAPHGYNPTSILPLPTGGGPEINTIRGGGFDGFTGGGVITRDSKHSRLPNDGDFPILRYNISKKEYVLFPTNHIIHNNDLSTLIQEANNLSGTGAPDPGTGAPDPGTAASLPVPRSNEYNVWFNAYTDAINTGKNKDVASTEARNALSKIIAPDGEKAYNSPLINALAKAFEEGKSDTDSFNAMAVAYDALSPELKAEAKAAASALPSNNNARARNRAKKYYDEDGKRDIEENREGKESDDEVFRKVGHRLLKENAALAAAPKPRKGGKKTRKQKSRKNRRNTNKK